MNWAEAITIFVAAGMGGFIGAAGGRFARFVVQITIRFGWNGVRHLTTRLKAPHHG